MAFCESCGKEIGDGVKFCPYCGKDTGINIVNTTSPVQVVPGAKPQMDVFKIISLVITVFAMLGIFLPVVELDYWIEEKMSIIEAWKIATGFFGDEGFFIYLMLFVATVFAVLCIGLGVRALIAVFRNTKGADTEQMIRVSMWCEVISMAVLLVLTWIINIDFGTDMLGLAFLGWSMLIVALLNIYVFTNQKVKDMMKF